MTMTEVWYRYEDYLTAAPLDEFENPMGKPRLHIRLVELYVDRVTPKGAWLYAPWCRRRFVLRDSRKRFACPTKEEALESFKRRKLRQISILSAQLDLARNALSMVEGLR